MMNRTVLLVEADQTFRTRLVEVLSAEGYRMLAAANARDALRIVEIYTPDLILINRKLPDLDGVALGHVLRASLAPVRVPLLFMGRAEHTRMATEDLWLTTPLLLTDLLRSLNRLLNVQPPAGQFVQNEGEHEVR